MFTAPAACAGVVAVIVVLFATATFVAALPPNVTVAPLAKPVPVIVTDVPPAVVPELGEMPLTVGAGFVVVPETAALKLSKITVPGAFASVVQVPAFNSNKIPVSGMLALFHASL